MQIDILSLAFSVLLNNASIEDTPYNRFGKVGFKTKHTEVSMVWERNNGIYSSGESLNLSYKTWKGTDTILEHFRNTGSDINFQTIRTRYWLFGQEVVYQNWFKGKAKYLNWMGFKHSFKRLTVGWSYSTDFEEQRFSKMDSEISYLKKLKGNWHISPSYQRKTITDGEDIKSDWRFQVNFVWQKEK